MRHDPPWPKSPLPLLIGLGLVLAGALGAQTLDLSGDDDEDDDGEGDDKVNAMRMLVEGSILTHIIIPRYGESLNLTSVLRAEKLVLDDAETINAENVRLEFFHPDESPRGRIDLARATLHDQRLLRSSENVEIRAEDATIRGSSLVYELDASRGFLSGPVEATLPADQFIAMNRSTRFPTAGAAPVLLAVSAAGLHADELPRLGEAELLGLDRLAVSRAPAFQTVAAEGREKIRAAEAEAAEADDQLARFLREAAPDVDPADKPDLGAAVPGPDDEPAGEGRARIDAAKGLYFDSGSGLLVFLEDVSVDHPEFSLTGADEVKVFFEKTEAAADAPETDESETAEEGEETDPDLDFEGVAEFGDPRRIVATGEVVLERKARGDDRKVKASGRQMVMDLGGEELIIRGGRPWVISDTANGKVVDDDGYIRINLKSGDASFVGKSEGFFKTEN